MFHGQTPLPNSKEKLAKHVGILAGAPVGGWFSETALQIGENVNKPECSFPDFEKDRTLFH